MKLLKSFSFFALSSLLFLSSCHLFTKNKEAASSSQKPPLQDTKTVYHPSRTIKQDLLHTKLEVSFNWQSKEVMGKATLTLKPYFYATKTLELDAKGMVLREVAMIDSVGNKKKLVYKYDNKKINITLDKEYKRTDSYKIFIDYLAQPELLLEKKLIANNDERGIFFINADGKNTVKPKQLWSQGEPESSSCWFPTIENAQDKMTQEVLITVDNNFQTLSNGLLKSSTKNADGSRTDYWKQDIVHSPYLTMIAVGEFAIVKDQWKNIEVNYYVEHKDSADAKAVFGNTVEMLTFFSEKLGVSYPWEKFSQIIVRDFVSGAMENTGAVVHMERVMRSKKELIDADYEDIIAHELFHHWFGDLVTCESWANLPLNESFATYGEYLWVDHKYGKEEADYHYWLDLHKYFEESAGKKERLIRYDYKDIESMFDRHSYEKGSCVIHMLRNYVGNEAFFAALEDYLKTNQFKTAEIANLRMSFEKVTGEDLNWFFNQWFFTKGHPVLEMSHHYNAKGDSLMVLIKQNQDLSVSPIFKMPVDIDIHSGGKPKRVRVWTEHPVDTFYFSGNGEPEWISVDPDKILLAQKIEIKSVNEWNTQYSKGKNFIDRINAFDALMSDSNAVKTHEDILVSALSDKFWVIRQHALEYLIVDTNWRDSLLTDIMDVVFKMAVKDDKSMVRANALKFIRSNYKNFEEVEPILKKTFNDPSNWVQAATIRSYYKYKGEEAYGIIKQKEKPVAEFITLTIGDIYKDFKMRDELYDFYVYSIPQMEGYEKSILVSLFGDYLLKQRREIMFHGLDSLFAIATSDEDAEVRKESVMGMQGLCSFYDHKIKDLEKDLADNKATKKGSFDAKEMQKKLDELNAERKKIQDKINLAIAREKDKDLIEFYTNVGLIKKQP